ncbi:hypothetical protein [Halocatena halophila]|uniref:hypothetical protein n=1 Tax=Halocatena halophila TaxID=2814576 RepID=UPI002ED167AA
MSNWSKTIDADDIDAWINALHSDSEVWGIKHESVARTTILAMAASSESYTGKDLYRVFHAPEYRSEFIEIERDDSTVSGRSVERLLMVDEQTFSKLASGVHAACQSDSRGSDTGGNPRYEHDSVTE